MWKIHFLAHCPKGLQVLLWVSAFLCSQTNSIIFHTYLAVCTQAIWAPDLLSFLPTKCKAAYFGQPTQVKCLSFRRELIWIRGAGNVYFIAGRWDSWPRCTQILVLKRFISRKKGGSCHTRDVGYSMIHLTHWPDAKITDSPHHCCCSVVSLQAATAGQTAIYIQS